jgi:hypothetical protein
MRVGVGLLTDAFQRTENLPTSHFASVAKAMSTSGSYRSLEVVWQEPWL